MTPLSSPVLGRAICNVGLSMSRLESRLRRVQTRAHARVT